MEATSLDLTGADHSAVRILLKDRRVMPGTSGVKFGTKVGANVSSGKNRLEDRVGFALGPEEEDREGKFKARIQIGTEVHILAYREPGDRVDGDGGATFWLV